MKNCRVAVLGATGAVGQTMCQLLAQRQFPLTQLYPLASRAGKPVRFNNETMATLNAADFDFSQADIALFSAGSDVSKRYAPIAHAAGCLVIDNTSAFRYDDDVPLVIPEVNPEAMTTTPPRGIIANPNCSTIQMLLALKPIHAYAGITHVNVATYQAVSGSGQQAIDALRQQTQAVLAGMPVTASVYDKPIAFNVLAHIDVLQDNGYTKEEMKMHWETQKILRDNTVQVNATCVRVPVFNGHSEAVQVQTAQPITAEKVRALLACAPGVTLLDTIPTPRLDADGSDSVFVGRVRQDFTQANSINLWVVGDNLRKGAALNAIQIAEACLLA